MKWLTLILIIFLLATCKYNPYQAVQYSLIYDGNHTNEGSAPFDNNSYKPGEIAIVKGNIGLLKKHGCFFEGWNTKNNGTGKSYKEGDYIIIGDSDLTLYAKWVVIDIDGNIYNTVTIGLQTWMVENLRTTRYIDSTVIPFVNDSADWFNLTTPGYCYYKNMTNSDSIKKYGALYNFQAVNYGQIAPKGWHVPTIDEWVHLKNYLIEYGYNWDETTTGNKVAKSLAAQTDWQISKSIGAIGNDLTKNNKSGFSVLPCGSRSYVGNYFVYACQNVFYWSDNSNVVGEGCFFYLEYSSERLFENQINMNYGFSVRLIKHFIN